MMSVTSLAGSVSGWECLPQDIQGEVISYLSASGFSRFAQVCKNWTTLLQNSKAWERLLKRNFPFYALKIGETSHQAYKRFYFNFQNKVYTLTTSSIGEGVVNALAIKCDGVLLSCDHGKIRGLDLNHPSPVSKIFGPGIETNHNTGVTALAVEGHWLASSFERTNVQVCNLKDKSQQLLSFESSVKSLAIKRDFLFVGLINNTMEIHSLNDNTVERFDFGKLPDWLEGIISFVTYGENVFIGTPDGVIRSYNLIIGPNSMQVLSPHDSSCIGLSCLAISKDGKHLFAGFCTGKIHVIDLASKKRMVLENNKRREDLSVVSLSLWDEKKLVVAFREGSLEIWDWEKNVCESNAVGFFEFDGCSRRIGSMVSEHGKVFVGGGFGGQIKIYDFTAKHDAVLKELISALKKTDKEGVTEDQRQAARFAYNRFARMPKAIRDGVSRELFQFLKDTRKDDYEDVFFRRNGKAPSDREIAYAMRAFLSKGGINLPPVRAIAGSPQDIRPLAGAATGNPQHVKPKDQESCLIC
jgi:WD40 repeat protein